MADPIVPLPANPLIRFEDFKKLEMITARVISAELHPQADRLLVLRVETGKGEKTVVAGIRKSYAPESLIGRTVILVHNLEPAQIRGVVSEGMLLACHDGESIRLVVPDGSVAAGQPVK